jgi:hypothetical protein
MVLLSGVGERHRHRRDLGLQRVKSAAQRCDIGLLRRDGHVDVPGQYKNVVGMGVVRLDQAAQLSRGSTDAVAVYVRKKEPEEKLSADDVIPRYLEIKDRGQVVQVPTKVIEQGEVSLESPGMERL